MTARPKSRPLELVERLAQQIRDHAAASPELWWKTPSAVIVDPGASWDTLEPPIVAIEINGAEPGESGGIDGEPIYEEIADVTVWGYTQDPETPQRAGLELLADLRRALLGNLNMVDASGVAWLTCGMLEDAGYTIATEFPEGGPGRALLEYRIRARYEWTPASA